MTDLNDEAIDLPATEDLGFGDTFSFGAERHSTLCEQLPTSQRQYPLSDLLENASSGDTCQS